MGRWGSWDEREGWPGRRDERGPEYPRRWTELEEERWRREARPEGEWRREWRPEREERRESDPPWVERGPGRRGGDGRGLVEWEDRGPLEWLGARARDRGERPRAPKGYKRADDRIRDEVCERIARCGADVDDVEVKVEHGEVTLTGSVPSREEKWLLEQVADDVFGVDDVHNGLRIVRPEQRGAGTAAGGPPAPHH